MKAKKVQIKNLVFEGGGVKGIAYLGMLDVLDKMGILENISRVAGTSAGAITAAIVSLGLPFDEMKDYTDTLDYSKVPQEKEINSTNKLSLMATREVENFFGGDIDCIIRLIHRYGWYSSQYFYNWIKSVINEQFDVSKKKPPYTFKDFKNTLLHKENRPFLDLYIIGTDMTNQCTRTFSYETTPDMEVAEAVRISMSIPLFFESIPVEQGIKEGNSSLNDNEVHIYSDGGTMRNYPLNIFDASKYGQCFDKNGVNLETLGGKFIELPVNKPINNLLNYIENLMETLLRVQEELYRTSAKGKERSIEIDASQVSTTDFDIKTGDAKYNYLYEQGAKGTKQFFVDQVKLYERT